MMPDRMIMRAGLAAGLAVVAALSVIAVGAVPARADGAPGPLDVIGVGEDTSQYALDFGADGDTSGDPGYNTAGAAYRLFSFDATADVDGRGAFCNDSTLGTECPLDPTVVYRAGSPQVQRIDGGLAGLTALVADTSASYPYLDFVRTIGTPTTVPTAGVQIFTLGSDPIEIAAATTTNAPAGLSESQLHMIYSANLPSCVTWKQVGGTSSDPIIPILPPAGSAQRSAFLAAISATPGTCATVTWQDNDPDVISGVIGATGTLAGTTINPDGGTCAPNCSVDAIMPFSRARLQLWNDGYFANPSTAYPGGPAVSPGIQLLTGSPSDGTPVFSDTVDLTIVYRWSDQVSTTPWQPGSKLNWAQALFCDPGGPTPFFQTPEGQADIVSAGISPSPQSCLSTPYS